MGEQTAAVIETNGAYFFVPFIKRNENLLKEGEEYAAALKKEYKKTAAGVMKEIDAFFGRYGAKGSVSIAEAKMPLTPKEFQDFKAEAEGYLGSVQENAVDKKVLRQLKNAFARERASRLFSLQTQIWKQVEELTAKRETGTEKVLGDIYEESYYRTVLEVQKGFGLGTDFRVLTPQAIENVLNSPWAEDGLNFRQKIQNSRARLLSNIDAGLMRSLVLGTASTRKLDIETIFERASTSAGNLLMTESAHFINAGRSAADSESGIEKYEFIASQEENTCEACRDLNGRVFELAGKEEGVNCPVIHPNCRCTTAPRFSEDYAASIMGESDAYEVSGDTTYEEWLKNYGHPVANLEENGIIQSSGEQTDVTIDGNDFRDIVQGITTAIDENLTGSFISNALHTGNYIYQSEYNYYLGRVIGDAISMLISGGMSVFGALEIIGSIAAGGTVTLGSGGTLVAGGLSIVTTGIAVGTVEIAYGATVVTASAGNFGSDLSKLSEVNKKLNSNVKIKRQMTKRGWTQERIKNTIENPYTTREASNKATGNKATVYIVQISDIFDKNWVPDSTIINPYVP